MSNVKVVISFWDVAWNTSINDAVRKELEATKCPFKYSIINCTSKSYDKVCTVITKNYYKCNLIIASKIKYLPVPSDNYITREQAANIDFVIGLLLYNYSLRICIMDAVVYDVYLLWIYGRHIKAISLPVADLFTSIYDVNTISDAVVWDKKITKLPDHDDDYITIKNADLTWPILLRRRKNKETIESYDLLDGNHRLVKAKMTGKNKIKCQIIPPSILDKAEIKKWNNKDAYRLYFACFLPS